MEPTNQDQLSKLKQPLLQNYQSMDENPLEILRGYLIYVINMNNQIGYCGFLAMPNEIVLPKVISRGKSENIVKVQNPWKKEPDSYRYKIKKDDFQAEKVITANVSTFVKNSLHLWVNKKWKLSLHLN